MRHAVRTWCAAAALASWLAGPLHAQATQADAPRAPFAVHWGKWAAAAAAVGFTALGIHEHDAGDAAYDALVSYCGTVPCPFASDGRYADTRAEALYQRVVRDDRSARAWLVGGQLAAVGSAVLFVIELTRERPEPNIPYSGFLVESGRHGMRIGWRIPLK